MELMHLLKYRGGDGQLKYFRLLEKVQVHWKDIGILMGIENATLEMFEHKWRGDLKEQCRDVFQTWLRQGSEKYSVKWSGLLELLEDVQLKEIAYELQEILGKLIPYSGYLLREKPFVNFVLLRVSAKVFS